jgi:hypothetical protein
MQHNGDDLLETTRSGSAHYTNTGTFAGNAPGSKQGSETSKKILFGEFDIEAKTAQDMDNRAALDTIYNGAAATRANVRIKSPRLIDDNVNHYGAAATRADVRIKSPRLIDDNVNHYGAAATRATSASSRSAPSATRTSPTTTAPPRVCECIESQRPIDDENIANNNGAAATRASRPTPTATTCASRSTPTATTRASRSTPTATVRATRGNACSTKATQSTKCPVP